MKILFAVALAGCSMGSDGGACGENCGLNDAGGQNDAGGGCAVISFAPANPKAGDHVKATATPFVTGVVHYRWKVDGVANTTYEAPDESAIGFDVLEPTSHSVSVDLDDPSMCHADGFINVSNPNGVTTPFVMRVIPNDTIAPPQEQTILVQGGTQTQRPVYLDPGVELDATVEDAVGMIPAYVKLTPTLGPAFDLVTMGPIAPRVQVQPHTILVVPMDNTLAPRVFAWMPGVGMNTFLVDTGTAVTGTVTDRSGNPLANAQVQLTQAGTPSTIATTAANGTFTARVSYGSTAMTTIAITPPAGSGLAKMSATAMFDLSMPINASFMASPATCDLAGTPVKRGGTNQSGAIVTVVGNIAAAGTIAGQTASGEFHASATAGGGTLPTLLVPRAALSAVAQIAAGDYAVAAIDTSTCAAQTIDAPARTTQSGTIKSPDGTQVLAGVRIEATPTGSLAGATLIPVEAVTDANGGWSMLVASGATYNVQVIDPGRRGTLSLAPNAFPAGTVSLASALSISGTIGLIGGGNVIEAASVQLLCAPSASCTGLTAQQPLAETATDITGFYQLAVPDPGSM
ncbi:MAG: hypothetical protein QM831_11015 [Kofleriaceae bacterium]